MRANSLEEFSKPGFVRGYAVSLRSEGHLKNVVLKPGKALSPENGNKCGG
jgi:hypothetical protein